MKNSDLNALFEEFTGKKVLVIGDLMVDAYLWGNVDRISPEAPVPVVHVKKKEMRLGGAGNVAINLKELGAIPYLCSVIGKDDHGEALLARMRQLHMPTEGIIASAERPTTCKTRVLGSNQHMIRIDEEESHDLSAGEHDSLLELVANLIKQEKIDVVLLQDYNKGVLTAKNIEALIALAQAQNIPVTVDPKYQNFLAYQHVTLFKPNLKELREGLKVELTKGDHNALQSAIDQLEQHLQNEHTLVTLSEEGVMISTKGEKTIVPAHKRLIADVSGAGDTVIAVASLCLACNVPPTLLAGLSNLAGGLVCEHAGVVPINKEQLLNEAKNLLN